MSTMLLAVRHVFEIVANVAVFAPCCMAESFLSRLRHGAKDIVLRAVARRRAMSKDSNVHPTVRVSWLLRDCRMNMYMYPIAITL